MPLRLVPPRKGKSPNYTIRGTYLGQHVDRSTGTGERHIARQALDKWKWEIEQGAYGPPTGPTFVSAAIAYMKAGGDERRRPYVMQRLLRHFADTPLALIDQQAIDAAALVLYPDQSPATRNRQVYTPVQAILRHAGTRIDLKRPKGAGGSQRTDWLWPEDAFRLFKEADKIDAEFGVFLRLLCYTGLRLSEALQLRWADVKLDEAFAYIPQTKGGDPRPVFLPPSVTSKLAILPRQHRNHVFRFSKSGRLYSILRDAKAAARLPDIRFHDLRHTWASWMRRYAGLDVRGLVATGAWKDSQAAERYAHTVPTEEAKKAALLPVEEEGNER